MSEILEAEQKKLNYDLLKAARNGDTHACLALIEAGADVNAKDKAGNTPLTLAVENGHFVFLRKLHKHGVDISSVQDLVLAHEAKEQIKIQESFQQAALEYKAAKLEYKKATLEYKKATKELSATPFVKLIADFKQAQNQTKESQTDGSPALATDLNPPAVGLNPT